MRKIALIFLYIILFYLPPFAADQEQKIAAERIFTLAESLKQTELTSPSLKKIKEDIRIAENRVQEAHAMAWPQLDLNANYSRYNTQTLFALPPTYGNVLLTPTNSEENGFYATRLSLTQLLFAGGRYRDTCNLASSGLERTKNEYNQTKNLALYNTTKAFYDLFFLKEKLALYQNLIKAEKYFYANLDQYPVSPYQKEKLNIEIEYLEKELTGFNNDYDLARLKFLDTIGVELNTIFDIQGELVPLTENIDLYKSIALAFEQRPERFLVQAQERMDALSLSLSRSERNPTVTLGANYQWEGKTTPLRDRNWNATLNLSIPLFDGWAKWSKVRQKRGEVEKVKLTKTEIDDRIRLEVTQAYTEYNYWQEQIKHSEQESKNLEKLVSSAENELERKKIGAEEFFTVTKNYHLSRLHKLEIIHKQILARAKLDCAIGKFLEK